MDVVKAVETYVTKLISVPSAMKVLLLDSHTVCPSTSFRIYKQNPRLTEHVTILDPHRIAGFHAICAPVAASVPHRSNRQP